MTRNHTRLLVAFVCAVAAGIGGYAWSLRAPRIPAYRPHPGLPAAFDAALRAARSRAQADGYPADDVRRLARLYQANHLGVEALACYRSPSLAGQLDARDHYYLAALDLEAEDLEGAKRELAAVVAGAPRSVPAHLELADCRFKTGDGPGAGAEYAAVLAVEPDQPQALYGRARVCLQQGDDPEAIEILRHLMAVHPEMTSGAALLAQVLDRRGEAQQAAAMRLWSRQKPEPLPADPWMDELLLDCFDVQRLSLLFEQYFNAGQAAPAEALMRRVAALDPTNPNPVLVQGWSLARAGRHEEAVAAFRKSLSLGGDPEKVVPFAVASLLDQGKADEARDFVAGYYARKPDSVALLTAATEIALKRGDTASARPLLEKLVAAQPFLYSANLALARIEWAGGERDAAAECLQRAARYSARDVPSRALLGQYYLDRHEAAAAIPPLEEAVRLGAAAPAEARSLQGMLYAAYLQAGAAAATAGRLDAASDLAERGIKLMPDQPDAYALEASAAAAANRLPAASAALARLGLLQPANPTVFLSLGDVQYHLGNVKAATENWRHALALTGAGDAPLRAALARRLDGPITEDVFK